MVKARAQDLTQGDDVSAQRKLFAGNVALFGLLVLSAFAIIHSTHSCRSLYAQLQLLESEQWYLQEDYYALHGHLKTKTMKTNRKSIGKSDQV